MNDKGALTKIQDTPTVDTLPEVKSTELLPNTKVDTIRGRSLSDPHKDPIQKKPIQQPTADVDINITVSTSESDKSEKDVITSTSSNSENRKPLPPVPSRNKRGNLSRTKSQVFQALEQIEEPKDNKNPNENLLEDLVEKIQLEGVSDLSEYLAEAEAEPKKLEKLEGFLQKAIANIEKDTEQFETPSTHQSTTPPTTTNLDHLDLEDYRGIVIQSPNDKIKPTEATTEKIDRDKLLPKSPRKLQDHYLALRPLPVSTVKSGNSPRTQVVDQSTEEKKEVTFTSPDANSSS